MNSLRNQSEGENMAWRTLLRDGYWLRQELDKEGDVVSEFTDKDNEEVFTIYMDPKEAYLVGKILMKLGTKP